MSYKMITMVREHKIGSASRKSIMLILADVANHDGSGIWLSKPSIAAQSELSVKTVRRVIAEFVQEGLLLEEGKRPCQNGFTKYYTISLDALKSLPKTTVKIVDERPTGGHGGRGDMVGGGTQGGSDTTPQCPVTLPHSVPQTVHEQSLNNPDSARAREIYKNILVALEDLIPTEKQNPIKDMIAIGYALQKVSGGDLERGLVGFYSSESIRKNEARYRPALCKAVSEGRYRPFLEKKPRKDYRPVKNLIEAKMRASAWLSGEWQSEWGDKPCHLTQGQIEILENAG